MRDVTEALAATSGGITRSENRLLLDAIAKVHGAFRGTRVEGLTRHDDRLDLFNPDRLAAEHWCDHDPAQARWAESAPLGTHCSRRARLAAIPDPRRHGRCRRRAGTRCAPRINCRADWIAFHPR